MKKSPEHIQALYLSQQLQKRQIPMGGMLFFKAVMQAQLDYTPESLHRLEKMFAQMRKQGITLQTILEQPQHKNFLLTIAVYIGDYVGKQIGEVPIWRTYHNFPAFSENEGTTAEFPYTLIAQFWGGLCLPFGSIMELLDSSFSLTEYIDWTCDDILSKEELKPRLPASEICNLNLKKIRTGQLIDNTMAYRDLLKSVNFDYSMMSLEHIDRILAIIKNKEKLEEKQLIKKSSYEHFMFDFEKVMFLYFVGCYIAMTAVKLAKTDFFWLNYEEGKESLDENIYNRSIEHNQILSLNYGKNLYFPFKVVTNYFFDSEPNGIKSAVGFAKDIVEKHASSLASYPMSQSNLAQQTLPDDWLRATNFAGYLGALQIERVFQNNLEASYAIAGWGMDLGSNEVIFEPLTLEFQADNGEVTLVEHTNDFACSQGSEEFPFGFVSYDGYADMPEGRANAIVIKVKVYSEPQLTLELIVPYRRSSHPFGFAIFPLIHNQPENAPDDKFMSALAKAFYEGAKKLENPVFKTDYWTEYYIDKHDIFAPPAWVSKPIEIFNPEDSQIEILPI